MPIKPISNCSNQVNHSTIIFDDSDIASKAVYSLDNPNRIDVNKVNIEHCVLVNEVGKKCDWLAQFIINNQPYSILIELKGSELAHGIEQLEESFDKMKNQLEGHVTVCRLSYSNSKGQRGLRDEHYKQLLTKLLKFNQRFKPGQQFPRHYLFNYQRTRYTENITDFQFA